MKVSAEEEIKNLFCLAVQYAVNEPFPNPDGSRNFQDTGPAMCELTPLAKTAAVVTAHFAAENLPFPEGTTYKTPEITDRQWRNHIFQSAHDFVRCYQTGYTDAPSWLVDFFTEMGPGRLA